MGKENKVLLFKIISVRMFFAYEKGSLTFSSILIIAYITPILTNALTKLISLDINDIPARIIPIPYNPINPIIAVIINERKSKLPLLWVNIFETKSITEIKVSMLTD